MTAVDALSGAADLTDDEVQAHLIDLPWYAANAPMKVKHKTTTEKVPLVMNAAQRYVWARAWELARAGELVRGLIPKARQLGMTTMFIAHKVHLAQVREGREMYMLLHDLKPARKAWGRAKDMHASIVHVPHAKLVGELKGRLLEWDTESNLLVESVGKEGVGRSETLHHVHGTELPSWEDPETTMDGIEESVPDLPGFESSIILESTSKGVGDWWHFKVRQAQQGRGGYALWFLPWWIEPAYGFSHPMPSDLSEKRLRANGLTSWHRECGVPLARVLAQPLTEGEVQIARRILREAPSFGVTYLTADLVVAKLLWRRGKIERRGAEKFKQEYPLTIEESFLGTGRPVFRMETVQFHRHRRREPEGDELLCPPRQRLEVVHRETKFVDGREHQVWLPRRSDEGSLQVWKGAEPGARYVIGGDPSEAVKDASALQVLKVAPMLLEQVAVWHGWIGQAELAWITAWLAQAYNNAAIVPESTGAAGAPYVAQLAKIRWPGRRLYRREVIGPDGRTPINRWGFDMNVATRAGVIDTIYNLLATTEPVFRHEPTIVEMEEFHIDDKGRPDHPTRGSSDLLMAWGIAAHVRHQFAQVAHKPRVKRGMTYEASNQGVVRVGVHDGGRHLR